jgi:hypothetical protein
MLKTIATVTLLVNQLSAVEPAWREHLDYSAVHRGVVTEEQAALWAAPATRGKPFVILQSASLRPVYVRFVEDPAATIPAAGTTHGWNATEIVARDPDGLAARLAGTPFTVIGPPKDLWNAPDAPRAMQALGPAQELLYFTRVIPSGMTIPVSPASTEVDRVFIMVVGGPSMATLRSFYAEQLGLKSPPATAWQISVLARALKLPPTTTFPLTVAALPREFLVELDEYPAEAVPRPVPAGHLPPGIAMVSFGVRELDELKLAWRAPPRRLAEFPYNGQEAAVAVGPAGEWLEFVELAGY